MQPTHTYLLVKFNELETQFGMSSKRIFCGNKYLLD